MDGGEAATPPSGGQSTIRHAHGDQAVVVTEVGAGLRTYRAAGRPVLDGYPVDQPCSGGRGQTLIPWPNRIRGGRYRWQGRTLQLDLTEPETQGAIHGLTRWANWRTLEHGPARVRLGHVLHACPGWPFVLRCEVDYELGPAGLTVRTTATNIGSTACPYGTGAHPYLHAGGPGVGVAEGGAAGGGAGTGPGTPVDTARVTVRARRYLPVDEVGIPVGREPVDGTGYDLRQPQPIGDRRLDVAYTDLERDADGRARVPLVRADGSTVTLWLDEAYPYLQLYTGDTLAEVERRRVGLAVEPMTCAPDAFNHPDAAAGLIVLQPGEVHTAAWGIEPG